MENRTETTVTRIDTIFGTCYLQIDSLKGIVCGGNISTHRKDLQSSDLVYRATRGWTPPRVRRKIKMDYVDGTSDDRTINNTMRHEYKVLSDKEKRPDAAC